MRVLIIGCGYVGTPLGAELVRSGHEVYGLCRSAESAPVLQAAGIRPLQADITAPASLSTLHSQLFTKYDWVVNCAAASGGGPEDYRRVYLEGTRNLIEWLKSAPLKKYVYTSSTGVYGQDDGSWVTENEPTEPASEPGRILAQTEQTLFAAAQDLSFPAVVLRVAGIYGPGRGYYLRQMLNGEARIEDRGQRFVNMIHRDDLVGAIIAGLQKGRPGQAYNVCDDEPVTQASLYGWLAEKLNLPVPGSVVADATGARRRGVTHKRISNGKLKAELGCVLRFPSFREGYEELLRPCTPERPRS